jgi:hypothetical protein
MLKKIVTLASFAFVFAALIGLAATQPASARHNDNHDNEKVTICHATHSNPMSNNPYNQIDVNVSSADGGGPGNGDHYEQHDESLIVSNAFEHFIYKLTNQKWGDIIPPIPGKHNGLNWTTVGKAIYYNGCNYPKTAAASVSVTPATCESGEILVYGNILNATFSGTANGTVGPGDYSVTATANQDSLFISNSATKLFEGSLDGPLTGEQCAPDLEASASIFVSPATCESAEIATVNTLVNATLTSSTGTTGPGDYEFQFAADQGAAFAGNESTLTLTGTLQGPLTGERCEEPEEDVANIKYGIVCSTAGAVVTFTNTGTASGDVTLNGEVITVAAGETIERTLDTTDAGLQIVIAIDGQAVYDQLVTCDTGDVLGDTDTPAVLPYTSGNMTAAIVAVIASIAATVGLISVASRSLLTRQ